MGDSLQDQLRALGLANKEQKKEKRKAPRNAQNAAARRASGGKRSTAGFSLEKAYALKERDERQKADRARKIKQAEDRRRREINNEIRKIVKLHRQNTDSAEIARNFMFRGRIRKINVTPEQLKALNAGECGIAYLSGGYHLLAAEHLEAVRRLSADHVPDLDGGADEDGDYPVPDDLNW